MISQYPKMHARILRLGILLAVCSTFSICLCLFTNKAFAVSGIDLVMKEVSGPSNNNKGFNAGTSINISNKVGNIGDRHTNTGFNVGLYLSTDNVISTGDIFLGSRFVQCCLKAGNDDGGSTTVVLSSNLAEGTYFLGAIADFDNQISEIKETNNTLAGNQVKITKPDLVMTAVSGPASVSADGTGYSWDKITVTYTLKNLGAGDYKQADYNGNVGVYLSTDNVINATDIFLGNKVMMTLGAGASGSDSITVDIPGAVAEGPYYLGTIADYDNRVPESNEGNNALAGSSIQVNKPDLVVTSVNAPSVIGGNCSLIPIQATLMNQGTGTTFKAGVRFYLSLDSTPVISSGDILFGESLHHVGTAVDPGKTFGAGVSVAHTNIADGTYFIKALADYDNEIAESSENNNVLVGNTVQIIKPDLKMDSVEGSPAKVNIRGTLSISDTVRNLTSSDACNFSVGFYFSGNNNNTISPGDIPLISRTITQLSGNQQNSATTAFTVPTMMPLGIYYLKAKADDGNLVAESNEGNNVVASTTTIQITAPDLVITDTTGLPTSPINAGSTLSVGDKVTNQGDGNAGAFSVGWYLSYKDHIPTTNDTFLKSRPVTSLAAGQSNIGSSSVTIPIYLTSGQYYLGAIADYTNQVPESDETNNTLAKLITVNAVPHVYIYATTINGGVIAGCHYPSDFKIYIVNDGGADSPPFTVSGSFKQGGSTKFSMGSYTIQGLSAGGTHVHPFSITIPTSLSVGTYEVVYTAATHTVSAGYTYVSPPGSCP